MLHPLPLSIKPGTPHATEAVRGAANLPLTFYPGLRDTIMGYLTSVSNENVKSAIDNGSGIAVYLGHGDFDRWYQWNTKSGDEADWRNEEVQDLANAYKTPVVFNLACDCGDLDKDVCLSEKWMRKNLGGAVASLASDSQAWIEPANSQCSVAVRATRDYWPFQPGEHEAPIFDLGGIKMLMDAYVASVWGGSSRTTNIYSFMWLGDPAMPVWSGGVPAAATVSFPSPISTEPLLFPVYVTLGGLPVENARVCVSKANDFYESGLTNGNGYVEFIIDPTTPGPFDVCASEGHVLLSAQGEPHTPMLPFWARGSVTGASGWSQYASMLKLPSGKPVKDGGCMAFDAGSGLIYASKGNKTGDFYSYGAPPGSWAFREVIPLGAEGKQVYKGSVICSDGNGKLYLTKGNNTCGFWEYDAAANTWTQKENVPIGPSRKKVKQGAGIAWAESCGVGFVYLLKGYRNEFYRYDPATNSWRQLKDAPIGAGNHLKYDAGSWLVSDGNGYLYAFKSKYHEFYVYDIVADSWLKTPVLSPMPIPGNAGNKKAKDGSCAAWYDGKIYAFKGGNTTEFWCYYPPDDNLWLELYDIPLWGVAGERKKVKAGAALAGWPGVGVYAFKGNKSLELWLYTPSQSYELDAVTRGADAGGASTAGRGPTLGGELPLMDGLDAAKPRWSWQGDMVCYSKTDTLTEREQVYQCHYGWSGPEQRVVDMDEDCEEPVYSPDGEYIAFQLDDTVSGFYQLCVTSSSDTGIGGGALKERGTAAEVPDCHTDATGDTYAVAPSALTRAQVPVAQSAAASRRTVCTGPGTSGIATSLGLVWQITYAEADHCYPEWSPDGEWLCYERDDENNYTQIWRVPAFGGVEQQLTFDNADHYLPSYLNMNEIVFTLSPDSGYDQIAKINLLTLQVAVLSQFQTDHDRPSPSWNGAYVAAEALDDSGNAQIVRMAGSGGSETWLTSGTSDIMEPDYGQDNQSIFAVRWAGIPSQIVWVDGVYGGYTAVTDSLAIRDNPDTYVDSFVSNSSAVYEREAWMPGGLLLGGGGRRKHGSGVYLSKFRKKPHSYEGAEGSSIGILALDNAKPNPAASRVTIHWQVPVEADVSLCVYNAAGQMVKMLAGGKCKPGSYMSVWNGTDAKGRRLANGVYFYALDNGAKRISRKVVLTE